MTYSNDNQREKQKFVIEFLIEVSTVIELSCYFYMLDYFEIVTCLDQHKTFSYNSGQKTSFYDDF